MKLNNILPIIILLGVAVLFFFPSPEDNFIAYFGTAILFVLVIIFLIVKSRKNSSKK